MARDLARAVIIKTLYDTGPTPLIEAQAQADDILAALDEYDLFIAYMSRCWCDGKADGDTHTPGCAGIEQERKLRALR